MSIAERVIVVEKIDKGENDKRESKGSASCRCRGRYCFSSFAIAECNGLRLLVCMAETKSLL